MKTKTMHISKSDLKILEVLRHQRSFSANSEGDIWPEATRGRHSPFNREKLRFRYELLDKIANEYLLVREGGGRFFVRNSMVYYRTQLSRHVTFLKFETSPKL